MALVPLCYRMLLISGAGYPVVFLKATLVDGSYHPVDSSEIAFKLAANLAFKAALPEAKPVLMEPIGELKVTIPDSYLGDVMGDLNKRRGRVMGMNPTGDGEQVLPASANGQRKVRNTGQCGNPQTAHRILPG